MPLVFLKYNLTYKCPTEIMDSKTFWEMLVICFFVLLDFFVVVLCFLLCFLFCFVPVVVLMIMMIPFAHGIDNVFDSFLKELCEAFFSVF